MSSNHKLILEFNQGMPVNLQSQEGLVFSDTPYQYALTLKVNKEEISFNNAKIIDLQESEFDGCKVWIIKGNFGELISFEQKLILSIDETILDEFISLENVSDKVLRIEEIKFGFRKTLNRHAEWKWVAVPFVVQADGTRHNYSTGDLLDGNFINSNDDASWGDGFPVIADTKKLRSEAWLQKHGDMGLFLGKYNNENVEMSLAEVQEFDGKSLLRFGGLGLSLYSEPSKLRTMLSGSKNNWGMTRYEFFENDLPGGFGCYKKLLREKGHCFPKDYNPPLHWNVLYDRGWNHSDPEKLNKSFTKDLLLIEAEKAVEMGCDLLYLDPGWEECEGTSLWDTERLGDVSEFINKIQDRYGLQVGFRDTGFLYRDEFPHQWYSCLNEDADRARVKKFTGQKIWRFCICCKPYFDEKVKRIVEIAKHGMKFLMIDEYAWFGPCVAKDHGHDSPTTAADHIEGVFDLIKAVKKECPDIVVECHDSIWPWRMRYLPVYFQQGFQADSGYLENWGFEYMWESLDNLKIGKALTLYYYALATDVPSYLHMSTIPDTDSCLFFWWAASTVRHLGIGGKYNNYNTKNREKYCKDMDTRWLKYKQAVSHYNKLKPFFVRGEFHGLNETAHLHTLPGVKGGVLNLFNLTEEPVLVSVKIPKDILAMTGEETIEGEFADAIKWDGDCLDVNIQIKPLTPIVVPLLDCEITF